MTSLLVDFSWNLSPEAEGQYSQSAEGKRLSARKPVSSKLFFESKGATDLTRATTVEQVHHHFPFPEKNAKGNPKG